jgi:hypothetical protein
MAHILDIDSDNAAATKFLGSYIQSGNLNFLIGSGASSPAIRVAGTIETELNALIEGGDDAKANAKCIDFIQQISKVQLAIASGTDAVTKKVLDNYSSFIAGLDQILFARKNILIPIRG